MTDKKKRGRPALIKPAADASKVKMTVIAENCVRVEFPVPTEVTIHQVLGEMSDIVSAPQESKRSGFKW